MGRLAKVLGMFSTSNIIETVRGEAENYLLL